MILLPGGMYMGCPCDVAKSVAESKSFHLEFCCVGWIRIGDRFYGSNQRIGDYQRWFHLMLGLGERRQFHLLWRKGMTYHHSFHKVGMRLKLCKVPKEEAMGGKSFSYSLFLCV